MVDPAQRRLAGEDAAAAETAQESAPRRRRRGSSSAPPPPPPQVSLREEVLAILEKTRVNLDAAIMRYSERVGGELDRVREEIASTEPPPEKVLERVKARLEEVRLKPQKGRVKDFARLEDLAEDLADLVPPSLRG